MPMQNEMPTQPGARPPFRRFLAAALSGGLGVFAFAADTASATPTATTPSPAANVAPLDQPSD
jgi:hypothetical protein